MHDMKYNAIRGSSIKTHPSLLLASLELSDTKVYEP